MTLDEDIQKYIYSVIRYVPDVFRGEYVNVGVVVGQDNGLWDIRQLRDSRRARAIGDESEVAVAFRLMMDITELIDRNNVAFSTLRDYEAVPMWSVDDERSMEVIPFALEQHGQESLLSGSPIADTAVARLQTWEMDSAQPVRLSERWLSDMAHSHRNLVQLTVPSPVLANSLAEAVERIQGAMLYEPRRASRPAATKKRVYGAVRDAFHRFEITGKSLCEHVLLQANAYSEQFDFAVANGRALHLTQTWSFQADDQRRVLHQVKSWGWTVENIKRHGGSLVTKSGRGLRVDADTPIAVVYMPPLDDHPFDAFAEGIEVFEELQVQHVPVDQAEVIAGQARELLYGPGML